MRTSLRVGMLIGGAGSIALSVLQTRIGLAVAPWLIIAGIISGLAVAKWLDHPSYGHQLAEGARAGLLSCGLPGFVALLSLLFAGPRDITTLVATTRFFDLDFSSFVEGFSGFGWAGIDVLVLLASSITGIVCSALLVQIFAWSKTARAVQVVQQARRTAIAMQRTDIANVPLLAAASNGHSAQGELVAVGAPVMAAAAASMAPTAGPARSRKSGTLAPNSAKQPAVLRMSPALPPMSASQQAMQPPTPQQYMPTPTPAAAQPAAQTPADATRPPRGKTSAARRVESRLNAQMRQALDDWAAREDGADEEDLSDEQPAASGSKRAPKPSTFLNSERPPKRNRKKNQTRDWLC